MLKWAVPLGVFFLIVIIYCCVKRCDRLREEEDNKEALDRRAARKQSRLAEAHNKNKMD